MWETFSSWLHKYESIAIWLEGIALVAIFVLDWKQRKDQRKDREEQHRETLAQLNVSQAQADALINSERAWLTVDLQWQSGTKMRLPTTTVSVGGNTAVKTSAMVECVITNVGKSPAWIFDKRIAFAILDPKDFLTEPDFDRLSVIDPVLEPIAHNGEPIRWEVTPRAEGQCGDLGKLTIVYGIVHYRDIFGKPRSTSFGYMINPSYELERIPALSNYNRYS